MTSWRRIILVTVVLMLASAMVGVRRGVCACSVSVVAGTNSQFSTTTDPACGTTTLNVGGASTTYTNYCVIETCTYGISRV